MRMKIIISRKRKTLGLRFIDVSAKFRGNLKIWWFFVVNAKFCNAAHTTKCIYLCWGDLCLCYLSVLDR
jgi:hypothetical protein